MRKFLFPVVALILALGTGAINSHAGSGERYNRDGQLQLECPNWRHRPRWGAGCRRYRNRERGRHAHG